MHFENMTNEQLEERRAQIAVEVEADGADLDALEAEARAIREEMEKRRANEERRAAIRRSVAEGAGVQVEGRSFGRPERRTYAVDSPEYRDAWMRNQMGRQLNAEERAAINATAAIPTQTVNSIVATLKKNKILARVNMTQFNSLVKIPVESSSAAASWTSTSTDSEDALTYVALNAYQLIKTVEVPADVETMSVSAFEAYLVASLANKIEVALEKGAVVGTGESQATGIITTLTTATGTFTKAAATKKDLLTIMGSLKDEYQDNACWIMPAAVFYGEVMNISNHDTFASINAGFEPKLFGKDVLFSEDAVVSSTDNILYGDLNHYRMNLAEAIKVDKDTSVGFRSNTTVYRAVCLADGKLDKADAFVRYTRAAS